MALTDNLDGWLETQYLGNTPGRWLAAGLVALGVIGALWLVKAVARRRLRDVAARTATRLDDLVLEMFERTTPLFLAVLGVGSALFVLHLPQDWDGRVRTLMILTTLVQAGLWGSTVVAFLTRRVGTSVAAADSAARATGQAVVRFVGTVAVWAVVSLLALENMGIDVTALIAGLGIGGIAVALAAQNILGDLFASVSILLDKPFHVGDFIVVGELAGTVEQIGVKTTRVRSLSGEQLIFANNDLLQSRIRNFKRMQERRVLFRFGVVYDTSPARLREIGPLVREIIEGVPQTRFDRAHFFAFGASSLDFEVVYYVLSDQYGTYMDIQQQINLALMQRLSELGVEFAYPTQTLYFGNAPAGVRDKPLLAHGLGKTAESPLPE